MSSATGTSSSTDHIERQITLDSPQSLVWRAISDVNQFNKWFGVALTSPFTPGAAVSGKITSSGYDHLTAHIWIEKVEPETLFSFRWHPHAIDPHVDYSTEPKTLVTFTLEPLSANTTRLTIVESGFDALPATRRATAFSGNAGGWSAQLDNIRHFLATTQG